MCDYIFKNICDYHIIVLPSYSNIDFINYSILVFIIISKFKMFLSDSKLEENIYSLHCKLLHIYNFYIRYFFHSDF